MFPQAVSTPAPTKLKRITVHYLPSLGLPDLVLETTGKAGYFIHSDENGPIGYRLFADNRTVLVPKEQVAGIDLSL